MYASGFFEGDIITVDFIGGNDAGQREDRAQFDIRLVSATVARGGTSTLLRGNVETVDGHALEVAVKVIRDVGGDIGRQLLRRELSVVKNTRHAFIVPFFGAADLDDRLVIVSPFMRNGNLLQYLRTNPEADRLPMVLQVADAVFYLHTSLKTVHGDLKCENVLVSDDGTALLTDFGLSTMADKPDGEATTRTGIREGKTLRFAAPELLVDNARSPSNRRRSKTPQTDVYAFGMLILQAFTGQQPWPGCSHYQAVARVLNRKRPHPRPGPEVTELGLDDRLWNICLSCWRRNPQTRPTMRRVRADLATFVGARLSVPLPRDDDLLLSSLLQSTVLRPVSKPNSVPKTRTPSRRASNRAGKCSAFPFFFTIGPVRQYLSRETVPFP